MSKLIKGCVAILAVLTVGSAAYGGPPAPPQGIPEIDPSLAAGALALITSGTLVLTSKLCKKK